MHDQGILQQVEEPSAKIDLRATVALITGLNLAFALCYLACNPPVAHAPTWPAAFFHSLLYLALACAAGAFGTWLLLPPSAPELGHLSRLGLRAWLFLPAITLFLHRQSLWAPLLTTLIAAHLATHLIPLTKSPTPQPRNTELFAAEIATAPASWRPFALSLCLYAALSAEIAGHLLLVTLLLSAAAFLLILHLAATHKIPAQKLHPYALAAAALLCTVFALSTTHIWRDPLLGRNHPKPTPPQPPGPTPDHIAPGYTTIVLYQPRERKKTLPPPPRPGTLPGTAHPWIIPFDGPYWYFKLPGITPGPEARTTHGDPLKVNVHSSDQNPLFMEAHQNLAAPLSLTCCRQIQLVFRNDPALGATAVGLTLTDAHLHSLDLGAINLGIPNPADPSPTEETLTFLIPKHAPLKQFDGITVTLLPSPSHRTAGRRVAIEHFVMIPN